MGDILGIVAIVLFLLIKSGDAIRFLVIAGLVIVALLALGLFIVSKVHGTSLEWIENVAAVVILGGIGIAIWRWIKG